MSCLTHPYSLDETLTKVRAVLIATGRSLAFELLNKAIEKARTDRAYAVEMEAVMTKGSTIELRELMSPFGQYAGAPPRDELPFYPHQDAVNGIDSALWAIKLDAHNIESLEESIAFVNLMRS